MVFSSAIFVMMFLPVVFISNTLITLIRKELSNYLLLVASFVFYAWGEPYLVLLMLVSVILNWMVGLLLSRTGPASGNAALKEGSERSIAAPGLRRLILVIGVAADLTILGCFKYAGFFAQTINDLLRSDILPVPHITLPIGISFFTFQAISYIVDVYRGDTKASRSFVNVALYISFFPQLIAGPIVKYKDINRQIESRHVNWVGVADGFRRFVYGLGKKILIANVLGLCADTVYSYDIAKIGGGAAWVGALAYTFQIYYDFSGYSDMAIGLGQMFGFRIPENFNYPYMSCSISEFWRRWHISLGSWFREYVYIPLGGNRKGQLRTYINLAIVFFLTGLWHGAALTFIIWGMYHGIFVLVERAGLGKMLRRTRILAPVYAFLVVHFGWVLFRADDIMTGIKFQVRMLLPWRYSDAAIHPGLYMDRKTIMVFVLAVIGMGLIQRFLPAGIRNRWKNSVPEAVFLIGMLLLCLASLASDTYNAFIYFQF